MKAGTLTAVVLVSAVLIALLVVLSRQLRAHPRRFEILGLLVAVLAVVVSVVGIVIAHQDTVHSGPKPPGTGAAVQADTPPSGARELQLLSCDQADRLPSQTGTDPTTITFVNLSATTVKLYWINFQGARVFYSMVSPNYQVPQQTYAGHTWLVTDQGDSCKAVFVAARDGAQAVIR
jgi:Co/Zn/Cd efflux system component